MIAAEGVALIKEDPRIKRGRDLLGCIVDRDGDGAVHMLAKIVRHERLLVSDDSLKLLARAVEGVRKRINDTH